MGRISASLAIASRTPPRLPSGTSRESKACLSYVVYTAKDTFVRSSPPVDAQRLRVTEETTALRTALSAIAIVFSVLVLVFGAIVFASELMDDLRPHANRTSRHASAERRDVVADIAAAAHAVTIDLDEPPPVVLEETKDEAFKSDAPTQEARARKHRSTKRPLSTTKPRKTHVKRGGTL